MPNQSPRWVLDVPALRAGLVGDVLCVELRGRFTAPRLHASLRRLRGSMERRDYGALIVNVMRARIHAMPEELAELWREPGNCPLAARPCAVVYDAMQPGATGLYETLGKMLAGAEPAAILGAFDAGLLMDATDWARKRARNYRAEVARRETRASARATSDRASQKPSIGRRRS